MLKRSPRLDFCSQFSTRFLTPIWSFFLAADFSSAAFDKWIKATNKKVPRDKHESNFILNRELEVCTNLSWIGYLKLELWVNIPGIPAEKMQMNMIFFFLYFSDHFFWYIWWGFQSNCTLGLHWKIIKLYRNFGLKNEEKIC